MSDLIKKEEQTSLLKGGKLSGSKTSFQSRIRQSQSYNTNVSELPNRLCLMLDCSSSMETIEKSKDVSKSRTDFLKDAVENFIQRCNFIDTAIAIETFPEGIAVPLTNNFNVLQSSIFGLRANGGTPMQACVERSIEKLKMTRGIIVSDGEASVRDETLTKYKEAKIPIDCVHISNDSYGEELLRHIAEFTGGIFLKFTDVSAFASSFGYLTPGYRAMLTDGTVDAAKLGAKEVR